MNAIYTNQSTRENLDLLYAQARVYDRVKNWNRLNFLFSIIVPLLLSFVTVYNRSREFVDSELLSSLLGLYGLLVLTFNIVISGHISALRRKAASIQEMYDCRVLGIRRNELKVEEIPRDDIIREAAYFRDSPEKARKRFGEEGWYVSKVYDAPQAVMALLCHGKNLGWDKSLREVLHVFYLSAFIVSPVAMLVYGIVMKSGLNEILFYMVFTLPVIRYFLLQFLDNRSSMKRSEKLKKGTVAKLAMRQPFVLFKGLTFQKLCLPGAFRPGDHHNKMLRPGLCVVHASPQYL
ncbi:TPA: S-4TM family putative pore-forming effector [Escherichia coli]